MSHHRSQEKPLKNNIFQSTFHQRIYIESERFLEETNEKSSVRLQRYNPTIMI